ncbi:hypothetical protein BC832DRAFT_594859 [Gaertneriomyces semiglobifer]|nr:hypothetical protein BC832DRAFT_594859 [Gaertneriomyces semiglobifer]
MAHALKIQLANHKDAAFATAVKLQILGVQSILDRLTLTTTKLASNGKNWEHLELRSAEIPTFWEDRVKLLRVAELLATVYLRLQEREQVVKAMREEENGLTTVDASETLRNQGAWIWGIDVDQASTSVWLALSMHTRTTLLRVAAHVNTLRSIVL